MTSLTRRTIQIDPEAARLMLALGFGNASLLFFAAKHLDRMAGGAGFVEIEALAAFLRGAGVEFSDKSFGRWLSHGAGVLWGVNKPSGRIYLYSLVQQTSKGLRGRLNLVQLVIDAGRADLLDTNILAGGYVETPIAIGQQWKANCYSAWFSSRIQPEQRRPYSRDLLSRLWGVTRRQLLTWEQGTGIHGERTYAQFPVDKSQAIQDVTPEHAEPYITKPDPIAGTKVRARARVSNLFTNPGDERRKHAYLPRKRRAAARMTIEDALRVNPAFSCGGGKDSPGKLLFFDQTGKKFTPATKRLKAHLRKHDDYERAHYAYIGIDQYGAHIVEASIGTGYTALNERADRHTQDTYFDTHGSRYAHALAWRTGL